MSQQELYHAEWRRSRHCDGGSCVEVAQIPRGLVAVRDGTDPRGPALVFTPTRWARFLSRAKHADLAAEPGGGRQDTLLIRG
jgi:hypothetical protein